MASLATPLEIYTTTFLAAFVSGFLPLVNIEAYLLAASALTTQGALTVVVACATVGQMAAKFMLYLAARGLLRIPLGKHQARIDKVKAQLETRPGQTSTVLFMSASTGLPPFYVVSVVAGLVKLPALRFLLVGGAGRFLRFGLVVALPPLIKSLWP